MVTIKFKLDLAMNDGMVPEIHLSQGDGPVSVEATVYYSRDDLFYLPPGITVRATGRTASGVRIDLPATYDSENDLVAFDLPTSVTGEMGRHEMELTFTDGDGGEFRSPKFIAGVEGNPIYFK